MRAEPLHDVDKLMLPLVWSVTVYSRRSPPSRRRIKPLAGSRSFHTLPLSGRPAPRGRPGEHSSDVALTVLHILLPIAL